MNKDPKMIHETALKSIIDTIDAIKAMGSSADIKKHFSKKRSSPLEGRSSIAKAASNLTLVFPVICSRGISIENSSMVTKAIEKNAASMLQKLFVAYQVQNEKDANSVEDFIKQFHTNLSTSTASLDDLFDLSIDLNSKNEATDLSKYYIESSLREDMKNINFYLPDPINETSINDYKVTKNGIMLEAFDDKTKSEDVKKPNDETNKYGEKLKDKVDYYTKQVVDSDFKKANELMPTTMIVKFTIKGDNGEIINVDNALIGVKAKLYPIGSDDIVTHITEKNSDGNWITNFFRATTREISFMKDFVFALDKAKIDAMSLSTRKSSTDKMWKVLERRAIISRLNKALRSRNSSSAITTLCISQEEVEYMRKNYNMDIEKIPVVLRLFNALNLMSIVIVDETLEVAKFIYDEYEPSWETVSFTHLEREASDNTYKKVVNLMTKIGH